MIGHGPMLAAAPVDAIAYASLERRLTVRLTPVRLITKDIALLTVQELVHLADVRGGRIRGYHGMNDPETTSGIQAPWGHLHTLLGRFKQR